MAKPKIYSIEIYKQIDSLSRTQDEREMGRHLFDGRCSNCPDAYHLIGKWKVRTPWT